MWKKHNAIVIGKRSFTVCFLLILCSIANKGFAQLDSTHYVPPLHSRANGEINDHYVYLSTPSTQSFQVEVKDGGGNPLSGSPYSLSNSNPVRIQIGNGQNPATELMVPNDSLNTTLANKGLILTASEEFYVNTRYRSGAQAAALTTKGQAAQGTQFRTGAMPIVNGSDPFGLRSFVTSIQAISDSTDVKVKDYDPNVVFDGSSSVTKDSLSIRLDAGESYVLSGYANTQANRQGFVAAQITSDKPIVVNTGNWLGNIANTFGQDIGIDQIVPVENLGSEYAVIEGNGKPIQERPMVVAWRDSTEVFTNGSNIPDTTIDQGEWYLVPHDSFSNTTPSNIYIRTSNTAYVYQFLAGTTNNNATPGMNFLAPLSCGLPDTVDLIPSVDQIGNTSYNGDIIAYTDSGSTVTVNGNTQTGGVTLNGNSDWEVYKISGFSGDVTVSSTGAMAAGFYGRSGLAGYGGLYSGYTLDIEADFEFKDTITYTEKTSGCFNDTIDVGFTGNQENATKFKWEFGQGRVLNATGNPSEFSAANQGPYELLYDSANYDSVVKDSVKLVIKDDECKDSVKLGIRIFEVGQKKPADVRNVSVIADSVVQISFKGVDFKDINRYEILRQKGTGAFQRVKRVVNPEPPDDKLQVLDTVNARDSQLCYTVATVRGCRATTYSDTICAALLTGKPANKAVKLQWQALTGYPVDSQLVLRQKNSTYDTIARLGATDTTFTDTPRPCNRSQKYRIKTLGKNGAQSSFSNARVITPFDTIDPAAPNVTAFSIQNATSAELRWNLSDPDVGQYELWLKRANKPWQIIDTVGRQTNYTYTDLSPTDTQYCARIVAIDTCAANRSPFSEVHCAVQLEGTAGNLASRLTWPGYASYSKPTYVVQKKQNKEFKDLATVKDTFFRDTNNISCNVPETYRIKTLSSGEDSAYSDTITLTPFDTLTPPSPQLQFASAQINGNVQVQWNWRTTTDQKYFEIWRNQGAGNYQRLDTVTYDSTFTDKSGNPDDNKHQYYVIAADSCAAANRSAPSDTDRIMVPKVRTGACRPENRISWNAYKQLPKDVDYYELYKQEPGSIDFTILKTVNNPSYTDTLVTDTLTYCYRVRAVDSQSGYSAWTDSICQEPFDYPTPKPDKVINSTVTRTSVSNGAIELTWKKYDENDTFALGYYVYHATGRSPGNFRLIDTISDLSDTTLTHEGINTSDSTHNYRLRVYNLCKDQSGFINTHRPVNLQAANQNLSIKLDWVPYLGFTVQQYRVQKAVATGAFNTINTLSGSDTNLVDSNVRCGIKYRYRILARGSKPDQVSFSDTLVRIGYDTIPPDQSAIQRVSVRETGSNTGEVSLDFDGASQANRKGYIIYRSEGNQPYQSVDTVLSSQNGILTTTDQNLNTADDPVSYYIKALDSCGNTAMPADTHQTVHLTATSQNAYNQLKWTAYQGWQNYQYEIQRKAIGANNWEDIGRLPRSKLQFRDSNVTCQITYRYRIRASQLNNNSISFSNIDTAQSYEITPPTTAPFKRASVASTGTNNGTVSLAWKPSPSQDVFSYQIERRKEGQNTFNVIDTVSQTNYRDSSINTYGFYYAYRLRAIDSCDNLSDSFPVTHRTINLEVSGISEAINISWSAYKGRSVQYYRVYKEGALIAKLPGDSTQLLDKPVPCDSLYEYQVEAVMTDTSIKAFSNTDSAAAFDNIPPDPVSLKRVSVENFNNVAAINWEPNTEKDLKAYQIYRSTQNSRGLQKIGEVRDSAAGLFYDTFDLEKAKDVCYQVRAVDNCGNAGQLSSPDCVIQLDGEALETLKNRLNWPPYQRWQKGIRTYKVFKQRNDSLYTTIAGIDSSQRSYVDENLADSANQFCYYIRAEGFGEDAYSRSTRICLEQSAIVYIPNTFSPGITPGLNDRFGPEGLYIANYKMQIYNRWGKEVFSTSNSEQWDGKAGGKRVPQGVYHYQIIVTSEDGSQQKYDGRVTVIR